MPWSRSVGSTTRRRPIARRPGSPRTWPGPHHDHGRILVALGRLGDAIAPLERAAALEPGNPTHWENLAGRHERAGRFAPAILAWERVLALAPDDRAYPHLALARALREEGRSDEAGPHFLAAIAIEPGSVEARVELGSLHTDRGEFAEAEAAYRGVLALEPGSSWGHAGLACLLRDRLPDADLAALEARLDDPDPASRASASSSGLAIGPSTPGGDRAPRAVATAPRGENRPPVGDELVGRPRVRPRRIRPPDRRTDRRLRP